MRNVKVLVAAGAITLLASAAQSADMALMPPPGPPPMAAADFGGWYLRGDIGMSNQKVKNLYNVLYNAPGTSVVPQGMEFDSAPTFGVGVGYQFNSWLRADITGEYRGKAGFTGIDIVRFNGTPIGVDQYTAKKSELLFMANGYADLGTWWNVTPFVGAGIGAARNTISGFTDTCPVGCGGGSVAYGATNSKWNFAWAVHAGLGYRVNNNLTVELAYRYLDLGDAASGDLVTYTGVNNVYNPMEFRNITSHDVKLGVRWMLNPEPVYAPPPLMRKG
jgi:opacity protein-like surface antigen